MAVFGALNAGSLFVEYSMKQDKTSFREYDSALDRAVRHAKDTTRDTERQKLGIGVDRSGFDKYQRALKSAEGAARRASSAASRIGRIGGAGLLALGTAAAGAGIKMVQLASDAAETESKFKIVFGKTTKGAIRQLDAFSKATGASRYVLRQQAADLQALIKPMGLSEKAAADMSVGMTKLATDLSSFNNVPVEDALLAIRAGLVGEAEPLRRFGVQLSAARIESEALAKGIKTKYSEMDAATKSTLAYSLILKDTTLAQGDATRTSNGLANQMRKFQNQVKDTSTDIGMALLPTVNRIVTSINSQIQAATPAIQRFGKRVGAILDGPGGFEFKAERIWQEFERTGAPDKIKDILITAFSKAAEAGIKTIVAVFNNANMWGKLAIAGILAAKFAPAIVGAFTLAGKALGRMRGGAAGAAGAAGGLGGGVGGPVPVYVTNWGGGPGGGAGKGGKGGGAGFGAVGAGGALLRGFSIAGAVITINEILAAMGLPNSRSVGTWLAKAMYGDADKIRAGTEAQRLAGEQLDWYKRHGGGANAANVLGAGLNKVFNESDNERRRQNIMSLLKYMAALEKSGKLAVGTTEQAFNSLGTKANFLGINVQALLGKSKNAIDGVTKAAWRMDKDGAPHLAATRRGYEGIATAADKSAAAARRAARAAGQAAGSVIGAAIAGKSYATGGYISGPHSRAVPATLHGDEYIINPRQADMIGRDRLDAALAATGAPTLRAGGSYKKGARPAGPIPGTKNYEREFSDLDYKMALAEGTEDKEDDKSVRGRIRNLITRRIDQLTKFLGMKKYSKTSWPLMHEAIFDERTSLTRTLNSYQEMKDATDEVAASVRTQSPGEAAAAMLAARTDMYRDFGSNFRTAGPGGAFAGARSGATVSVPVTFTQPPSDPHAFARSLAFELGAAL